MMNIFLTNLGKYNEGELIGEWVSLPVTEDELEEILERIGIDGEEYEEYFITDYECSFYNVGEYESLETLNEIAEDLEGMTEEDMDKLKALLEYGENFESAKNLYEEAQLLPLETEVELGMYVVEELNYIGDVSEKVKMFLDWESIAEAFESETSGGFTSYGFLIF